MKFLKLAAVSIISLGALSGVASANSELGNLDGRSKIYSPDVEQSRPQGRDLILAADDTASPKPASQGQKKAVAPEVAGFVIAARGQLTAINSKGESRSLERRSKFYANETIKTGPDARAQLRFKDRALMTLKPNSQLDIGEYHYGGAEDDLNQSFMKLVSGGFRTISGAIGKLNQSAYRIETPAASIGIRGTDYELIISLDGKVFAAVHDGGISIVNDLGELDLGSDSDYIYAEVGAGQSPTGLDEMPEVFEVKDGEKQELTDEQKAKLAEKIKEGKERLKALIAELEGTGEEASDEELQDIKDILNQIALNDDPGVDTRIDPKLLEKIKTKGFVVFNNDFKNGVMGEGRGLLLDENTSDERVIMLTQDGQLIAFKPGDLKDADGNIYKSGHDNVHWGAWNEGVILEQEGKETPFKTDMQTVVAVQQMEAQQILALKGNATASVSLPLMNFYGTTTAPDKYSLTSCEISCGQATLDFNNQKVDGYFYTDINENATGLVLYYVDFNFNGPMINKSGEPNHNFKSSANVLELATENSGVVDTTKVKGAIAQPTTDGDLNTAAFSGSFDATLPADVTGGLDIGVKGLFLFGQQSGLRVLKNSAP